MTKIKRYMYPENPDFCSVRKSELDALESALATAERRYDELAVLNGGTPIYGSLPISKSE